MSRFRNERTGVVVSVDDAKDHRFAQGDWTLVNDKPSHLAKGDLVVNAKSKKR